MRTRSGRGRNGRGQRFVGVRRDGNTGGAALAVLESGYQASVRPLSPPWSPPPHDQQSPSAQVAHQLLLRGVRAIANTTSYQRRMPVRADARRPCELEWAGHFPHPETGVRGACVNPVSPLSPLSGGVEKETSRTQSSEPRRVDNTGGRFCH